jgi:bifunctional UDP-N-acetylglucosamine pyrophosphorylase/glucosamine-1-phosphate N-acetyltransferase
MNSSAAVILAAGKGKRMKSDLAKVLHPVAGLPMVVYVIRAAREAGAARIILVVGHQREKVIAALEAEGVDFVVQKEQLGTAHALVQAKETLAGYCGDLLVLAGDTPLLTGRTLTQVLDAQRLMSAKGTVLTALLDDPGGYGRIVRTPYGMLQAIVEEKDATAEQKKIREINTGAYCFRAPLIFDILDRIGTENRQGEYYLTDAIAILRSQGMPVAAVAADDWREVLGVNSSAQLAGAEGIMLRRSGLKTEKKG